jgi:hypothetical protein
MKSSLILFLSLLVTLSIVSPSAVTFLELSDDSTILADLNEGEDKNEEKKELDEKLVFINNTLSITNSSRKNLTNYTNFFSEAYYINSVEILLPPPKSIT